jgi:hypothetical protein
MDPYYLDLSTTCCGRFTSGERALGILWIGGWVDPIDGLEEIKKKIFLTLTGLELRYLGPPTLSQSH